MSIRVPLQAALPGLEVHPLQPDWTPIEALVLVKCLDEHGVPTWAYRTTSKLNDEELLGVLVAQAELVKRRIAAQWEA